MGTIRYRERIFPTASLLGFGLVGTFVLGVASGYAISTSVGVIISGCLLLITIIGYASRIFTIEVTENLKVGAYLLPLKLISAAKVFTGEAGRIEFRATLKSTDLVIGTASAANYLRIEISDPADPFQVWFIPTRKPEQLLAAIN